MRIIAGTLGGRRLIAPKGLDTRPTTDRVREAWFSILGPLEGTVLDLYAGTGALAFEALSRGATRAVFVESARAASACIEQNAEALGLAQSVTLLRATVEKTTRDLVRLGPFDLVVSDPPWTTLESCERTLRALPWSDLVAVGGRLVLGHPKKRAIQLDLPPDFVVQSQRAWGDSGATFFERASE